MAQHRDDETQWIDPVDARELAESQRGRDQGEPPRRPHPGVEPLEVRTIPHSDAPHPHSAEAIRARRLAANDIILNSENIQMVAPVIDDDQRRNVVVGYQGQDPTRDQVAASLVTRDALNAVYTGISGEIEGTLQGRDEAIRELVDFADEEQSDRVRLHEDLERWVTRTDQVEEELRGEREDRERERRNFIIALCVAGVLIFGLAWAAIAAAVSDDEIPADAGQAQQKVAEQNDEIKRLNEQVDKERERADKAEKARDQAVAGGDRDAQSRIDELTRDNEKKDRAIEDLGREKDRADKAEKRAEKAEERATELEDELRRAGNNRETVTETTTLQVPGNDSDGAPSLPNPFRNGGER